MLRENASGSTDSGGAGPGSAGPGSLSGLEQDSEFSFDAAIRLVGVARRRWWLLVILPIIAAIVGTYQVARKPIVFHASSTLLLESRPRVVDKVASLNADEALDTERFANSQVHILSSERMASQVERRLHAPAGSLGGAIQVTVDRGSQLLTLSVDDLDAEKARSVVNAFTDVYIESTISDHAGVATDAAVFLGAESHQHRADLEADERALYEFQRTNGLPASNFEESHKIYASTLQALHAQASTAFGAGVRLKAELEQLNGAHADRELSRRLALSNVTDRYSELHSRYVSLVELAAQLEARYGQKHPKVIETQEGIASVGAALDREVQTAEAALNARARANTSEQAQLRLAISNETHKALELRQKELEYNRLKRRLDEDRESYDLVAKRQKELEIQAALKQSYVRRLDAAAVASPMPRPIARAAGLGIIIGLLLAMGLAFLLDVLDDTIRSPHEAESRIRGPLLGFVSELASAGQDDAQQAEGARAQYVVTYPRSVVAEQCHSVATTIYSLFLGEPPRALAVVSSASRDGKTLTCVNLAAALSARGKRVLLIDADLRRGRLHTVFTLPRSGGLFELATGQLEIAGAIRRTFIPNVDVISSGEVPEKVAPARVLELPHLRTVMAELREMYDLVIFDTAPVPMVSDVVVMKDLIDAAIGVFRAGQTSVRLSGEMARHLGAVRVNFLGWVLNGVSENELKRRYYSRYGYGSYGAYEEDRSERTT